MGKDFTREQWKELAKKLSMQDIMMIAVIEDILPDSAYEEAFDNVLEMLLDKEHDISIDSIVKLLHAHSEVWETMLLGTSS